MTDVQKFFADARRCVKRGRAEGSEYNSLHVCADIGDAFVRAAPRLGSLPRDMADYWLRTYIEPAPDSQPTDQALDWLAGALCFLDGRDEDCDVFSREDWEELRDMVSYEADSLPVDALSAMMAVLLGRGVI